MSSNNVSSFHYGVPGDNPAAIAPVIRGQRQSDAEAQWRETHAYERGLQEGETRARNVYQQALDAERQRLQSAMQQFEQERESYFRRVEQEVVRLALAIAKRVLHREANLDPLMLQGVVRVALDRVSEGSSLVLRVSPEQRSLWEEYFRLMPDGGRTPQVLGDAQLEAGQCRLETSVGSVELGIQEQVAEIEKGLFDLLGQRTTAA